MPRPSRSAALSQPLFSEEPGADAPLAARMRPRVLDDFVGQEHLIGPEGALTRVVKPGYLPSMVLWGPPGSGKTTLARLLADRSGGTWRQLSAVSSGVADVRALVAEAKALRDAGGRTVAFIDELHRFNKSQQLPRAPRAEVPLAPHRFVTRPRAAEFPCPGAARTCVRALVTMATPPITEHRAEALKMAKMVNLSHASAGNPLREERRRQYRLPGSW